MQTLFAISNGLYRPLLVLTIVLYASCLICKLLKNERAAKRLLYATLAAVLLLMLLFIAALGVLFFATSRANGF